MMRLVYLSPVSWFSFAQRPHRFVEWFQHRTGGQVLWVEPYPTRLPTWADLFRNSDRVGDQRSQLLPPWLEIVGSKALPIEPMPFIARANRLLFESVVSKSEEFLSGHDGLVVVGKPSDLALAVLDRVPKVPSVYDAMDDFPEFYSGLSRRSMHAREKSIIARVSHLFVSSTQSMGRFSGAHGDIRFVLNACDASTLPDVLPERGKKGRTIIGYVGTIGLWFDWSFVIALAELRPGFTVQLIGPVHGPVPSVLPANIELCPPLEHQAAMRAACLFSVGLIAFLRTSLTASVDPIKYYEYRAMGIPIVSTAFGEMALRREEPGVYLVDDGTPDSLNDALVRAMSWRSSSESLAAFRLANTWEARFDAAALI